MNILYHHLKSSFFSESWTWSPKENKSKEPAPPKAEWYGIQVDGIQSCDITSSEELIFLSGNLGGAEGCCLGLFYQLFLTSATLFCTHGIFENCAWPELCQPLSPWIWSCPPSQSFLFFVLGEVGSWLSLGKIVLWWISTPGFLPHEAFFSHKPINFTVSK